MPHVFVAHISFWRSRPSCHTTTLQTKHTQIQDTLVANSHACFKEPALKTLKPILRKHLQEYKIYKASKALFFKPLKLLSFKAWRLRTTPCFCCSHIFLAITPLMSYDNASNQTHSNSRHFGCQFTCVF